MSSRLHAEKVPISLKKEGLNWQLPFVWFLSKGLWLACAYCVEFLGMSIFPLVWYYGLVYVYVDVLCMLAWV